MRWYVLVETVATETVPRHHGRHLKMAVTALFTNRGLIVRVVAVIGTRTLQNCFASS